MRMLSEWTRRRQQGDRDRERSRAACSVSLPNHWPLKCLTHKPQLRWTQMISGQVICNFPACRAVQPHSIRNHISLPVTAEGGSNDFTAYFI